MTEAIFKILGQYDEKDKSNVWSIQGNWIIKHSCLERVAAKAGIKWSEPTVLRAEKDEAVILVRATLGDREEWSIGEALVNTNYKVSGKQAAYVYAMAEKRGKDRVVLKLVGLHGLAYSEDEADDFKEPNSAAPSRAKAEPERSPVSHTGDSENRPSGLEGTLPKGMEPDPKRQQSPILEILIKTLRLADDAKGAAHWAKANAQVIDKLDEDDWKILEAEMDASKPYQDFKAARAAYVAAKSEEEAA